MPGSINGWDVLNNPDWSDKRLVSKPIPGRRNVKMYLRKDIAPLFLALAADYNAHFQRLYTAEGYDARAARESTLPSDHYSGTAIDLNGAREGAYGMRNYKWWKVDSRQAFARTLLDKYQVVMWGGSTDFGGSYTNNGCSRCPDWMHWALKPNVTLSQVQAVMEELKIDSRGYQNSRVAGL